MQLLERWLLVDNLCELGLLGLFHLFVLNLQNIDKARLVYLAFLVDLLLLHLLVHSPNSGLFDVLGLTKELLVLGDYRGICVDYKALHLLGRVPVVPVVLGEGKWQKFCLLNSVIDELPEQVEIEVLFEQVLSSVFGAE